MTVNGAVLYEQLHYTERHIAAGAEAIEKQRRPSRAGKREAATPTRAAGADEAIVRAEHRRSIIGRADEVIE